jgi:ubiquinone/menaquinone biosynthesis C-methylase UbiE
VTVRPPRRSSEESLDDAKVVEAFARVSNMPQMRLLRSLLIRRALSFAREGEAADLGCGGGQLALSLARRAPGLRVTGLDLSDEMIALASTRAAEAGLGSRATFRAGDVRHLPFIDGSLDLVVSSLSLHHWSRPVIALDEVCRVLRRPDPIRGRTGGAYVIFDLRRDVIGAARALLWFATNVVVPRELRLINEPLASCEAAYTPEEATGLLARSRLTGWRVAPGPLWLTIEGRITGDLCGVRVNVAPSTTPARGQVRLASGAGQWS